MVTAEERGIQIGISRPRLPLVDLPTPEEAFDKPKIGRRKIITVAAVVILTIFTFTQPPVAVRALLDAVLLMGV